ncbi:hypothetical protein HDU96_007573 [Phlyctochytrium bullatum]|nr:hypothetical protein HDU96_007573 [Phlyctochytrium bullatum]
MPPKKATASSKSSESRPPASEAPADVGNSAESMAILEIRLKSYLPGEASKKGWSLKVPRRKDVPTVARLAEAGFFHAPTPTHPHRVACYLCGPLHASSSSEPRDVSPDDKDPMLLHVPTCAFRLVRGDGVAQAERLKEATAKPGAKRGKTVRPEWNGWEGLEPWGRTMCEARVATFVKGVWPHAGKKGWKCTAEKVAEAGMYLKPTKEEPDYCECAYCHLGLAGWEADDDPAFEHRKRNADCVMFKRPGSDDTTSASPAPQTVAEDEPEPPLAAIMTPAPPKAPATKKGRKAKGKGDVDGSELEMSVAETEVSVAEEEKKSAAGRRGKTTKKVRTADFFVNEAARLADMFFYAFLKAAKVEALSEEEPDDDRGDILISLSSSPAPASWHQQQAAPALPTKNVPVDAAAGADTRKRRTPPSPEPDDEGDVTETEATVAPSRGAGKAKRAATAGTKAARGKKKAEGEEAAAGVGGRATRKRAAEASVDVSVVEGETVEETEVPRKRTRQAKKADPTVTEESLLEDGDGEPVKKAERKPRKAAEPKVAKTTKPRAAAKGGRGKRVAAKVEERDESDDAEEVPRGPSAGSDGIDTEQSFVQHLGSIDDMSAIYSDGTSVDTTTSFVEGEMDMELDDGGPSLDDDGDGEIDMLPEFPSPGRAPAALASSGRKKQKTPEATPGARPPRGPVAPAKNDRAQAVEETPRNRVPPKQLPMLMGSALDMDPTPVRSTRMPPVKKAGVEPQTGSREQVVEETPRPKMARQPFADLTQAPDVAPQGGKAVEGEGKKAVAQAPPKIPVPKKTAHAASAVEVAPPVAPQPPSVVEAPRKEGAAKPTEAANGAPAATNTARVAPPPPISIPAPTPQNPVMPSPAIKLSAKLRSPPATFSPVRKSNAGPGMTADLAREVRQGSLVGGGAPPGANGRASTKSLAAALKSIMKKPVEGDGGEVKEAGRASSSYSESRWLKKPSSGVGAVGADAVKSAMPKVVEEEEDVRVSPTPRKPVAATKPAEVVKETVSKAPPAPSAPQTARKVVKLAQLVEEDKLVAEKAGKKKAGAMARVTFASPAGGWEGGSRLTSKTTLSDKTAVMSLGPDHSDQSDVDAKTPVAKAGTGARPPASPPKDAAATEHQRLMFLSAAARLLRTVGNGDHGRDDDDVFGEGGEDGAEDPRKLLESVLVGRAERDTITVEETLKRLAKKEVERMRKASEVILEAMEAQAARMREELVRSLEEGVEA